jgi:hypothetical protein
VWYEGGVVWYRRRVMLVEVQYGREVVWYGGGVMSRRDGVMLHRCGGAAWKYSIEGWWCGTERSGVAWRCSIG